MDGSTFDPQSTNPLKKAGGLKGLLRPVTADTLDFRDEDIVKQLLRRIVVKQCDVVSISYTGLCPILLWVRGSGASIHYVQMSRCVKTGTQFHNHRVNHVDIQEEMITSRNFKCTRDTFFLK